MCDRSKTSRAGSQVNFIEFVVAPIYAQASYSGLLFDTLCS